jgi:DNA repair protein RadA/Sms
MEKRTYNSQSRTKTTKNKMKLTRQKKPNGHNWRRIKSRLGGRVSLDLWSIREENRYCKSTLCLQISLNLPYRNFVRRRESEAKKNAERITTSSDNCYILTETKTQNILTNRNNSARDCYHRFYSNLYTLTTLSLLQEVFQIRETTAELIKF